jgi:hypothetical protein
MDQATLDALAAFPQTLEHFYAAVPSDYKHWTPPSWDGIPSETFTAIEQICHIRDIELDGYRKRFHRALNETDPALDSLDSYVIARQRHYSTANAAEVLATFRTARTRHRPTALNSYSRTTRPSRNFRRLRSPHRPRTRPLSLQPRPATPRWIAMDPWENRRRHPKQLPLNVIISPQKSPIAILWRQGNGFLASIFFPAR